MQFHSATIHLGHTHMLPLPEEISLHELQLQEDFPFGELMQILLLNTRDHETALLILPVTVKPVFSASMQVFNPFSIYTASLDQLFGKTGSIKKIFVSAEVASRKPMMLFEGNMGHQRGVIQIGYDQWAEQHHPEIIALDQALFYKAKPLSVAPESARESLSDDARCFLGVSLGSPAFSQAKVAACAEWISKRFTQCLVSIADTGHRLTLQIVEGLDEQTALEKALRLGEQYIQRMESIFARFPACQFQFIRDCELVELAAYHAYYADIQKSVAESHALQQSIDYFVDQFLKNKSVLNPSVDVYGLSREYLLEELAIFSYLVSQGWRVSVYPGSIAIMDEIAYGKHPSLPAELRELVHVSLQIRKR